MNMKEVSTNDLVKELSKRSGVELLTVAPTQQLGIQISQDWNGKAQARNIAGSAIVLVITD